MRMAFDVNIQPLHTTTLIIVHTCTHVCLHIHMHTKYICERKMSFNQHRANRRAWGPSYVLAVLACPSGLTRRRIRAEGKSYA